MTASRTVTCPFCGREVVGEPRKEDPHKALVLRHAAPCGLTCSASPRDASRDANEERHGPTHCCRCGAID